MLRRLLALLAPLALVLGVLSPQPAEADPVPLLTLPSHLAAGAAAERVFLQGVTTRTSGMKLVDPLGDFHFSSPSSFVDEVYFFASLVAVPTSSEPHDLVLSDDTGTLGTCTGCLTPGTPAEVPTITVTPSDGALDISASGPALPEGDTLSGYHAVVGGRPYDLVGGSAHVSGLTNGTSTAVAVSAVSTSGVGRPAYVTRRPGKAPEKPVLSVVPSFHQLEVSATTQSYGYAVQYDVTLHHSTPGYADDVYPNQHFPLVLSQVYDEGPVTLTAVAHDELGTSPVSDPLSAIAFQEPTEVSGVRFSYSRGQATVTWKAPRYTGNAPLVGYDLLARWDGGPLKVLRVTTTSAVLTAPAGKGIHGNVRAVNAYARASQYGGAWSGTTSVGLLVALDRNHHAAYRLADAGTWHSLGGPAFASGISAVRTPHHGLVVVASDAAGRLWTRTLTTSWRIVAKGPCFHPALSYFTYSTGPMVVCTDGAGHIRYGEEVLDEEVLTAQLQLQTLPKESVGLPTVIGGGIVFRTKDHDAAGHNLFVFDVGSMQGRRLPLRCTGDPGSGVAPSVVTSYGILSNGGNWVACADGRTARYLHSIVSLADGRYVTTGAALSTVDLLGSPSVWQSGRGPEGYVGFVAGDGTIREYQVAAGRWRTIAGLKVLPSLGGVAWTG